MSLVRVAGVVALATGLVASAGCGAEQPRSAAPSVERSRAALEGAPAPLARLHRDANRLLDGGPRAFRARLRELKGHPVVVNKWASWCPPCRAEFPFFQRQAIKRGREVAFLGVDTNDNQADAAEFLREFPVSYPSYEDADGEVARLLQAPGFPTTAFYDSKGRPAFVHQGGYASERKLAEDIERYAR